MSSVRKKSKDLLLVKGPTEDGSGVHVIRARPEQFELGTMRPLEDGRPLDGEVVRVSGTHPDCPFLYEVDTEFCTSEATTPADRASTEKAPPPPAATATARSAGPPQVASAAYRRNWDAIWNRPTKRGPVLN